MSNEDQHLEVEEDDKPKQAIIIPQQVMKSPLDVVNIFPSKFQNGTFKAHNPPPSDNEESDNEDSDTHSVKKHGKSAHAPHKKGKKSKYKHKQLQELKHQITLAKAEAVIQKTKNEILLLKFNEFIAHSVYAHQLCEAAITEDEHLRDAFAVLSETYSSQREDYSQFKQPQKSSPPTTSVQQNILLAEMLVEKTLEQFYETLANKSKETLTTEPLHVSRIHLNEITLRERQQSTNQSKLDDQLSKGFSQSSFSDASEISAAIDEVDQSEEISALKEQIEFLMINIENLQSELTLANAKQADANLYEAKIEELTLLVNSDESLRSQASSLSQNVLDRNTLLQRVTKLEKRSKALQTENNDLKTSLKVFHSETAKLEKQIEIERKNNVLVKTYLNEEDFDIIDSNESSQQELIKNLSSHIESLKGQVAELQRDNENLQIKVENSQQEFQFVKSGPNSQDFDKMEDAFDEMEAQRQDQWKIKLIQAKSSVLDEKQKIEHELSELNEKLQLAEDERQSFKRKNDNLLSENTSFMALYKTVEKQLKDAIKDADKMKRKLESQAENETKISEQETEIALLTDQLKELTSLKTANSSQLADLVALRESNKEIESQLADSKKLIEQLQTASSAKNYSSQSNEQTDYSTSEVQNLEKIIEDLKREKQEIELQKNSFQQENLSFRSTYKKIEKQLRKSIKEKESLKKTLDSEKATSQQLIQGEEASVFDSLRTSVSSLTEERNHLTKQLGKLESKLKQTQQEASMDKMEREFEQNIEERIKSAQSQVLEEKHLIEAEKEEISKQLEESMKESKLIQVKSEAILSENQNFYQNINSVQKHLKATIRELDQLRLDNSSLKQENQEKEELIAALKQNPEITSNSSELLEKQAELEQEIRRLKSELAAVEEQNSMQKLERDFDSEQAANRTVEDIVKQKSRAEIEVSNVKDSYKTLEKEFKKSVKANDEILRKLSETENRVKELEGIIQQNEEKAVAAAAAAAAAIPSTSHSESTSAQTPMTTHDLEDLKLENKALRMEVNMLKRQNDELEAELQENFANDSDHHPQELDETFETRINELNAQLEQKTKEFDSLVASSNMKSSGLNSVIKSLDKELKRQVKENDESKKKLKNQEDALSRSKSLISDYRNQLNIPDSNENDEFTVQEDQSDRPIQLRAIIPSHTDAQYSELSQKYAKLEKEYNDLKSEYELQLLENEETSGQYQKTKTEIDLIETEKQELERKTQTLTVETSNNHKIYSTLEKEFKKSIKEIDNLKKEIENLSKFKKYLNEIVEKIESQTGLSRPSAEDIEDELEQIQAFNPLKRINQQADTLHKTIADLQEKLSSTEQTALEEIERNQTTESLSADLHSEQEKNADLLQEINTLKEENRQQSVSIQLASETTKTLEKSMRQTITENLKKVESLLAEIEQLKQSKASAEQSQKNIESTTSSILAEKDMEIQNLKSAKLTSELEKQTLAAELSAELERMTNELRSQQSLVEKQGKDLTTKHAEIDDLKAEIEDLTLETRIVDQYKEQAEILKNKSDILESALLEITQKKDILAQKLKAKDARPTQELLELRETNSILAHQNELLKQDHIRIVADLEELLYQQQLQQQQQQQLQYQQQMGTQTLSQQSLGNMNTPASITTMNSLRSPKNFDQPETRNSQYIERIQELNQKVQEDNYLRDSNEYDPSNPSDEIRLSSEQFQDETENEQTGEEDNAEDLTASKLVRLEENFRNQVDSLKAIIQSKELEISKLRSIEFADNSHPLLHQDQPKQTTNTTQFRKQPAFTKTDFALERHQKTNSAAAGTQVNASIDLSKLASNNTSRITSPKLQQQNKVTSLLLHQQNPTSTSTNERLRKSMPQGLSNLAKIDQNTLTQTFAVGAAADMMTAPSPMQSQQATPTNIALYTNESNSSKHSNNNNNKSLNNNNNNAQSGTPNSAAAAPFLDQMYLKCIERSKNLLSKKDNLTKSHQTKTPQSLIQSPNQTIIYPTLSMTNLPSYNAQPTQSISSLLLSPGSAASTNANTIPLNSEIHLSHNFSQRSVLPTQSQQQQQQQQQQLSQLLQQQQQLFQQQQPPNEHYFSRKTFNQVGQQGTTAATQQQQQQQQLATSSSQSQLSQKRSQTTTTSPVIGALPVSSPSLAPLRLDYSNKLTATTPTAVDHHHLLTAPTTVSNPNRMSNTKRLQQSLQQQLPQQQQQQQLPGNFSNEKNSSSNSSNSNNNSNNVSGQLLPRYEGQLVNNLRHGKGCYFYQNGETYQGEWKSDKRHGFGILKDEFNIDIYNGDWESDMYSGQGRLRNRFMQFTNTSFDYRNFDTLAKSWQFYSGDFKQNLMHGTGTLLLANSEKFIGSFAEGKVHGQGQYHTASGEIISGFWHHSKLTSKQPPRFQ